MAGPRSEKIERTDQSVLGRAEGVVSGVRERVKTRLGPKLAGAAAAATLVFLVACGGSSEAPKDVSVQPTAATVIAGEPTPTPTAAPRVEVVKEPSRTPEPRVDKPFPTTEPQKRLTDQEFKITSAKMEEVRAITDEFIRGAPIEQEFKKYHPDLDRTSKILPSPSNVKEYYDAVELWARAQERSPMNAYYWRRDKEGNTVYDYRFGESFGWFIKLLDRSGQTTEASVVFALREDPEFYKIYGPEIAKTLQEFYQGEDFWIDRNGEKVPLLISRENMRRLAESAFVLPPNLNWRETYREIEGGQFPGMTAAFSTSKGPARVTVDGNGLVQLTVRYNP